jgi:YaiO family outer membrane protein
VKRRVVALALALCVSAAPPETAQQLYEQGVKARLAGDTALASELLRRATEAEPGNADAHLQLGLALMAEGRLDEAESALQRTLQIAPGYEDARIGLARLAQRRGDSRRALAELGPVAASNSEAAELRRSLAGTGTAEPVGGAGTDYAWQLNLEGNYSALDRGRKDWREGAIELRHQGRGGTAVAGRVEHSRRFGLKDTYGEVRVEQRFAGGHSAYALAGATPEADFRPRWHIGAGGAVKVADGPQATVLTVDARQARYRSGDIQTVTPGIEQYLADGRLWLTARLINLFDENGSHRLGWLARGDVQASERLRLFAGVADAPDVSEGIVTDTFSLFGGLSYDLSERTTFRLSAAREEREGGADRLQLGVGLGFRF